MVLTQVTGWEREGEGRREAQGKVCVQEVDCVGLDDYLE